MNDIDKHAHDAPLTGEISPEAVLQVVTALYAELHRSEVAPQAVSLSSHLERDLGLDSLGRVELALRLEGRFGVQLRDAAIGSADTVADLMGLLTSAARAGANAAHPDTAAAPVSPIAALRPPLGTPKTATTLNEVLLWHAGEHPNATHAVVLDEERSQAVTYAQLRDGAQEVAGALQQAKVQPGTTIALMLPTAVEYLYVFFGVLLVGAVPVPIYPPTRRLPNRRARASACRRAC